MIKIVDPKVICGKCGLLERNYARRHYHELGLSMHRICCCQEEASCCDTGGSGLAACCNSTNSTVDVSISGIQYQTICGCAALGTHTGLTMCPTSEMNPCGYWAKRIGFCQDFITYGSPACTGDLWMTVTVDALVFQSWIIETWAEVSFVGESPFRCRNLTKGCDPFNVAQITLTDDKIDDSASNMTCCGGGPSGTYNGFTGYCFDTNTSASITLNNNECCRDADDLPDFPCIKGEAECESTGDSPDCQGI